MAVGFVIPVKLGDIPEAKRQLEELKKTASSLNGDALKEMSNDIDALSKGIEDVEKSFGGAIKTGGKFSDMMKTLDNGAIDVSASISLMEDNLYAMVIAGQAGSEEFVDLQKETAKLKQTVIDVDKEIDLLAENRGFASIGGGIGQVAERLATLDFEGAGKSAEVMNKSMQNLGKMGSGAINGLAKTVTNLSSAFIKMGVALLANPIFLISAAIIAIVAAVAAVLDSLGLLQPVLDGIAWVFGKIGDLINWVVDGFKALTDWIGITDHAGEAFVDNQIKKFKELTEATDKAHENRIFKLDEEMKIMAIQGKDTLQLEQQKQKMILEKAKKENALAEVVLKNAKKKKDADDEEIIALEEKISANKELIKISSSEIRVLSAKKEQKAIDDAKKTEEERAANAKEWAANAKKYAQDRINFERQIQDLQLEQMKEGVDKEIAISNAKYSRLIADTKSNESMLQKEKTAIIELLTKEQVTIEAEIRGRAEKERLAKETEAIIQAAQNKKDVRNALLQELEDIDEQIYQSSLTKAERDVIAVQDKYFRLITLAEEYGQSTIDLERQRDAEVKAIQDEAYLKQLEANATTLAGKLAYFEEEKRIILENTTLTEEERLEIEKEYAEKRKALQISAVQGAVDTGANVLQQGLAAWQAINDARMESDLAKAEGNEAKQTQIRKKAFEQNKKLQIAQATVGMIGGAVLAFTGAMQLGPIAGPIVGAILAASTLAMGIANISKIKNTKFEGGGGGGGASVPNGGAPNIPDSAPQINMFGSANNFNNGSQGESEKERPIEVIAKVSEFEMTETQKKVSTQKERASL